jgi:hypothetical protein
MPIIPAMWKMEIGRILVQGQLKQKKKKKISKTVSTSKPDLVAVYL